MQLFFTTEEKLLFKIINNDVSFYLTLGSIVTCDSIHCNRRKCIMLQRDNFVILFLFFPNALNLTLL